VPSDGDHHRRTFLITRPKKAIQSQEGDGGVVHPARSGPVDRDRGDVLKTLQIAVCWVCRGPFTGEGPGEGEPDALAVTITRATFSASWVSIWVPDE